MSNLVTAIIVAEEAHRGQLYGPHQAYVTHLIDTARCLRFLFGTDLAEDYYITAFLHDIVEDTHYTLQMLSNMGFNKDVIEAVELVTKNDELTYMENISRIIESGSMIAMKVKAADNLSNLNANKASLTQYSAKREEKYKTSFKTIIEVIQEIEGKAP